MKQLLERVQDYLGMPIDLEKGRQYILEAMYPKTDIDLKLSEELQQRVVQIAVESYKKNLLKERK